ncbi:methyltransferase FkbM family [Candidatus Moduliflexus flocculans]|uniref:Methyltransferase FkbM family n=1 Tax=Candidatus Moduliflexus flocculans TaxID=1499966 RepID=A0A0S6VQI9_9BACT|nr:methyltransferase FkbM family [Candidatus Moduliflexus flocculans]
MKKNYKQHIIRFYQRFFAKRKFYSFNKLLFECSLRGLGILNAKTATLTGELFFLQQHLKKAPHGGIVFDVGANVGHYSQMCHEINPFLHLYAFEPLPANYEKLHSWALSQTGNITTVNLGCGERNEMIEIYDYAEVNGSSHASLYKDVFEKIHRADAKPTQINLVKLDDFAREKNIEQIYLLKIDVEGHELSVLRGTENLIRNGKIHSIQFEFGPMNMISRVFFQDVLDFLRDYRCYRLLPDGMIPLNKANKPYRLSHEHNIFAFQNIVALRNI